MSAMGAISGINTAVKMVNLKGAAASQGSVSNFADTFKNEMASFMQRAKHTEHLIQNYSFGAGNLEEIAPQFKNLMIELEVKTKIVAGLANVVKNLTSINI